MTASTAEADQDTEIKRRPKSPPNVPPTTVAAPPSRPPTAETTAPASTPSASSDPKNKSPTLAVRPAPASGFDDFGLPLRQFPTEDEVAAAEAAEREIEERALAARPNAAAAGAGHQHEGSSSSCKSNSKNGNSNNNSNSAGPYGHRRGASTASSTGNNNNALSEFSHQGLTAKKEEEAETGGDNWQDMPAFAPYDLYDDDNQLVAREHDEADDETYAYSGLGGAGRGYTRIESDDDAVSVTSMDDNTQYLFKSGHGTSILDDEQRDAVSQLQATKDLLTEGQRIAYVGLTRLEISAMVRRAEAAPRTRGTRKEMQAAGEAFRMWGQMMMIRLYAHMDISPAEQVMIEQLAEHGVMPADLTPVLLANSRVRNPMAEEVEPASSDPPPEASGRPVTGPPVPSSSSLPSSSTSSLASPLSKPPPSSPPSPPSPSSPSSPPPYESREGKDMPEVKTPSQLPATDKIDIDLRWTVLCDLFLVLIANSVYDARSRVLLECVAESLAIPRVDICRFEKRVTDALEMQQAAEQENWNEDEHMENRRKLAQRRRYIMMGLATVGGGLVIGLSAGLLAPVIGGGLAAGLATFGVAGTNGFLAGSAGAAIITTGAAASGSYIGGKAADKRTGAVKTFEYRPLHNNKRVHLIITVSGWLTGKVDDVRLPFSTVDSAMGDIYSILWEPEILRSIGDTINILATEALTQGLQQILGSTILISLMAALQLPIVLSKLSYLIDNPWAVSLDRATAAGLILADSLIDRNLGTRPVTLVGYSLGSRVIFSALQELARKGAYGLVQDVFIFGSPVVVKKDEYLRAGTVVSGRFINGYSRNDWILGYLFRLTGGGIRRVAGLAAVEEAPWIENVDVTEHVAGHMDYRRAMPKLLRECGWLVESDEFSEIEDPDPENHGQRQRELISEIEEARKELESQAKQSKKGAGGGGGGGGVFGGIFGKRKKGSRQEWELYEDPTDKGGDAKTTATDGENSGGEAAGGGDSVLFDVEAIRAELAREVQPEDLQVRELESTLPPMRIDVRSSAPESPLTPMATLRPHQQRPSYQPSPSSSTGSFDRTPTPGRAGGFSPSQQRQQQHRMPSWSSPGNPGMGDNDEDADKNDYDGGDGIQMTFDEPVIPRAGGGGWVADVDADTDARPVVFAGGRAATFGSRETAGMGRQSFSLSLSSSSMSSPPPLPPPPPPPEKDGPHGRPQLTTARTVPNVTFTEPWGDTDDEEFGKEKEIQMTFA